MGKTRDEKVKAKRTRDLGQRAHDIAIKEENQLLRSTMDFGRAFKKYLEVYDASLRELSYQSEPFNRSETQ
jgi:hypothetical protein